MLYLGHLHRLLGSFLSYNCEPEVWLERLQQVMQTKMIVNEMRMLGAFRCNTKLVEKGVLSLNQGIHVQFFSFNQWVEQTTASMQTMLMQGSMSLYSDDFPGENILISAYSH